MKKYRRPLSLASSSVKTQLCVAQSGAKHRALLVSVGHFRWPRDHWPSWPVSSTTDMGFPVSVLVIIAVKCTVFELERHERDRQTDGRIATWLNRIYRAGAAVVYVNIYVNCYTCNAFSALTLLVGQKEGHPACKKPSGGVLAWLSVWNEVHMVRWCHCHSLSLASVKSRLVLPFWYRLTRVVLDKEPLNGCVCVCVAVILWWACLLVCPLAYLTKHTSKLHDIIFACCVARCGVAVGYLLSVLLMTSCLLVTSQAQATQKGVCLNWLTKGSTGQRAEYVVYDCLVATTRVHLQTFSGLTPRIPGLFTDTFEHIHFYTFYFFFCSTFL